MKKLSGIIASLSLICTLVGCTDSAQKNSFARVEDGHFVIGENTPYYFVGTNFWYGVALASQAEGGDRLRLAKELDYMKSIGINNLRVLVGSDGDKGIHSKVEPVLQTAPGVYDDQLLDGLDYLMVELSKREMFAVLYLNNSWEWSGGYCQYLQWTGRGKYPIPGVDGWDSYMTYVKQFHAVDSSDSCKIMFAEHVKNIVSRTNRYTGKPYTEDPSIFSWQIANEPRAFSDENKENFAQWIGEVARLIKSLDPNHLVSTGSEGSMGCERDIQLWKRIHAYPEIDYTNIHIWPYNWRWVNAETLAENLDTAKLNSKTYINEHVELAKELNKPVVLEEFGFPRDQFIFTPGSPTTSRDSYYGFVFDLLCKSVAQKGLLAGCNFWAWGGYAIPAGTHTNWVKGDDYCGDPAQEEQGLNSVFINDSTNEIIKQANRKINELLQVASAEAGNSSTASIQKLLQSVAEQDKFLIAHQDFPFYGFEWTGENGRSDIKDVCGDYPAMLGCDLGELELGKGVNLDGVNFDHMRKEIVEQHKRGGITTLSWHPRNPLTDGDAWDVSSKEVVSSILAGGQSHTKFIGWLDMVAEFITSLKDEQGAAIPVIFRPWHEHTGSWFWWGKDLCSAEQYKTLWRTTITHLQNKGAQIVIAYSPTPCTQSDYLDRYPGDAWVDIMGIDAYHGAGAKEADKFVERLDQSLAMISTLAQEHGKTVAVTETGLESVSMPKWWTEVLMKAIDKHNVSYVLLWRNANTTLKDRHFYAPYAGQESAADFVQFYNLPQTIFVNDINQIKQ